ncbi:hypothetical protein QUF74_06305 [Candidatus Halobeggiatoa sp. HSG11]|nr:hypothetical protein [Candidatus Halobeggiatoa sp. HSG11]
MVIVLILGNELFAWFESTESKSRINFLSCLSQGVEQRYVLNEGALEYIEQQKFPKSILANLNKTHQESELKEEIQARFEEPCRTETCYESLNQARKASKEKISMNC